MSRRRRQGQSDTAAEASVEDVAEADDTGDDELARELEAERQQLLAAAAKGNGRAASNSDGDQENDAREGTEETDEDNQDEDAGESDLEPNDLPEEDEDSADEWQPPEPPSKSKRQSKRRRRQSSTEDSDDDLVRGASEEVEEPAPKKSKKAAGGKPAKSKKSNGTEEKARPTRDSAGEDEADDSFDEEAERVQAEVEAAAAWADVRRRKEAAQTSQPTNANPTGNASTSKPPSAPSLSAWLGKGPSASSSSSELASSLPMPTTCASAQIVDRNSLFIGYVYPLTTASPAYISALLSHLTRVVHPTVSIDLLPPQFANAPANKRGSSHDMYAYRVFELKRGRTGLAGPDDFSLQEEKEDDGERWGGDRVLKVAREEGASDVLVVVSRWYGGELLGPVRFDHIENAARAALQEHMAREEVEEFRQRIQHLDRKIAAAKAKLQGGEAEERVNGYEDLTLEKGQRLWLARQRALEALQKRSKAQASQSSQARAEEADADDGPAPAVDDTPETPTDDAVPASDPPTAVKSEPEPATPTQVKAESPDPSPILVKQEGDTSPPPLTIDDDPAEDDKSTVVKLEPQDDAEDLTGWDDLS